MRSTVCNKRQKEGQKAFACYVLACLLFFVGCSTSSEVLAASVSKPQGSSSATVSSEASRDEGAASTTKKGGSGSSVPVKYLHLFGYVEFRSALKNMPKWERVLYAEKRQPSFDPAALEERLTPAVAARWKKVAEKAKDLPLQEQAKLVNQFFNQWPYKTDLAVWGVEDYWATPQEFVRKSGDCEDYAIVKYYALRSLGVPADKLRIVAVIEKIRKVGHAILVVFVNDNAYVLDNLSSVILPHTRFVNYEPKFSVNEEYRWAHIKPLSQPK